MDLKDFTVWFLRHYEDGKRCSRCGSPVLKSDVEGYGYQCFEHDEDLLGIEVKDGEKFTDDEIKMLVEASVEYINENGGCLDMKTVTVPNYRYYQQQEALNEIAKKLGVVAFRPDYHGKDRDKNTVLLYLTDDARYNEELDRTQSYVTNEQYRKHFFVFENTDVNGNESYDFANHGTIDLRGIHWEENLEGFVRIALVRKLQNNYAMACGGYAGIREADEYYNDLNREQIKAFRMAHGKAFLGDISLGGELYEKAQTEDIRLFREYKDGDLVYNFGCVFVIPEEDEELRKLILEWNRDHRLPKDTSNLEKINSRIDRLGGIEFVWY